MQHVFHQKILSSYHILYYFDGKDADRSADQKNVLSIKKEQQQKKLF